jgi:hypothetical protein
MTSPRERTSRRRTCAPEYFGHGKMDG